VGWRRIRFCAVELFFLGFWFIGKISWGSVGVLEGLIDVEVVVHWGNEKCVF